MSPNRDKQHKQPIAFIFALGARLILVFGSLAAAASLHAEAALGRLFFTPEQREILDRQRQTHAPGHAPNRTEPTLTVNGIVMRSNAQNTVWINGLAHTADDLRSGSVSAVQGLSADKLRVQAEGAPPAELRVGETLDVVSGKTLSPLNDGHFARGKRSTPEK